MRRTDDLDPWSGKYSAQTNTRPGRLSCRQNHLCRVHKGDLIECKYDAGWSTYSGQQLDILYLHSIRHVNTLWKIHSNEGDFLPGTCLGGEGGGVEGGGKDGGRGRRDCSINSAECPSDFFRICCSDQFLGLSALPQMVRHNCRHRHRDLCLTWGYLNTLAQVDDVFCHLDSHSGCSLWMATRWLQCTRGRH